MISIILMYEYRAETPRGIIRLSKTYVSFKFDRFHRQIQGIFYISYATNPTIDLRHSAATGAWQLSKSFGCSGLFGLGVQVLRL
jgi:hypothetical protein